jgi:hypothetical protein
MEEYRELLDPRIAAQLSGLIREREAFQRSIEEKLNKLRVRENEKLQLMVRTEENIVNTVLTMTGHNPAQPHGPILITDPDAEGKRYLVVRPEPQRPAASPVQPVSKNRPRIAARPVPSNGHPADNAPAHSDPV